MDDNVCYGCFWWECGACDGVEDGCDKILAFQNPEYQRLYEEYDQDCQAALEPVTKKWKDIFKENK